MIEKEKRKKELSEKYRVYRTQLRNQAKDINLSPEERDEAQIKLQKLRRNTSQSRVVNRCRLTGRPRGYLRRFGMSRIAVRECASRGLLPGVTKASW